MGGVNENNKELATGEEGERERIASKGNVRTRRGLSVTFHREMLGLLVLFNVLSNFPPSAWFWIEVRTGRTEG